MKKTIYLYSGEGTSDIDSKYALIRHSQKWAEIETILKTELGLDLISLWDMEIGRHRCPHSPLLTAIQQICLADLWNRWGYVPDAVLGHSIGEIAAAHQAGFYTLKEAVLLAHRIGLITARIEDGVMLHGWMTDGQIQNSSVHVSAVNFADGGKKHVTLSGRKADMAAFAAAHPDFTTMRMPHPWHHPDYGDYQDQLDAASAQSGNDIAYVSGVTGDHENRLDAGYWKQWLTHTVDFVRAVNTVKETFGQDEVQVIEIGFHPVLEHACTVFDRYRYASSAFRGEDEIKWILHQRRTLDQAPFLKNFTAAVRQFRDPVDFGTALAYQGFTSITFVAFTAAIESFFPSLKPQDFFRYKSIDQLLRNFGVDQERTGVAATRTHRNQVVIAGMSARLPSAVETLPQFWQMLLSQADQVGTDPVRGGLEAGLLSDRVSRFDHAYFDIAEAEAETMDPQQILALELAELAWQDAGLDPAALNRKRIGVYIGAWNEEFSGNRASVYYPTGTNPSIIAARISYHYDLRGPSWVSNTACSSSLVALHYAAKDIEAGRVDYALVGGVNMILDPGFTDTMRHAGFLSKDNRCKTFDDSADGYVRAEGGGLVLLANKNLVETFYAVLAGSAVNQNGGRAQIITAPHPGAQEELILDACEDAGIAPQQITYLECHGTGTKIGDPIEISALQNTVAKERTGPCYLGAIKSNLGHLESAAGIAGLIKGALTLNQGQIPPNLHFDKANSYIDFESHQLQVVTRPTPIDHEAYVGVSSFGFGGTNAHIILKGAEERHRKALMDITVPFDRDRAKPLSAYLSGPSLAQPVATETAPAESAPADAPPAQAAVAAGGKSREDITRLINTLFFSLTSIQGIDPEIELTEQGLDSMSITELVSQLEDELAIDLDPDIVFEYPLLDQLVDALVAQTQPN